MAGKLILSGTNLRYALTLYLQLHGPATISTLLAGIEHWGFRVNGRPSKVVSDALRWEVERDRVRRLARSRYGPGQMPRGTEHRIHQRVLALRAEANGLSLADWLSRIPYPGDY